MGFQLEKKKNTIAPRTINERTTPMIIQNILESPFLELDKRFHKTPKPTPMFIDCS
jgi:hypothetical protein